METSRRMETKFVAVIIINHNNYFSLNFTYIFGRRPLPTPKVREGCCTRRSEWRADDCTSSPTHFYIFYYSLFFNKLQSTHSNKRIKVSYCNLIDSTQFTF